MAMGEVKEVKLYGFLLSGYCTMVHHALKLKGVAYEYVEEDLQNKSQALLELNPVYKKVPVLVVDGKPVAESLVILEYVNDMWKDPPLLPEDPHKRSKVRFWADFVYQKLVPGIYAIQNTKGEEQQKAIQELIDHLSTLEDGIQKDLFTGGPFINGERPGLLDVIMGSAYGGFKYMEGLTNAKIIEKERTPLLCSSIDAYVDLDVVKETAIPDAMLQELIRAMREKASASSGA
ncbi:glutathione S-transferase U10 [Elaeis guineensis]|uniref:Glutathione S-transferase n=1 Tax=Elaeis guineensis var. tenera TaxID=51953 RepID=A0A6I9S3K5_ELAGV|nr:glutathione S-transferase U10 [Elaeis guineensis]